MYQQQPLTNEEKAMMESNEGKGSKLFTVRVKFEDFKFHQYREGKDHKVYDVDSQNIERGKIRGGICKAFEKDIRNQFLITTKWFWVNSSEVDFIFRSNVRRFNHRVNKDGILCRRLGHNITKLELYRGVRSLYKEVFDEDKFDEDTEDFDLCIGYVTSQIKLIGYGRTTTEWENPTVH
jgi:hypothetical protein